MPPSGRPGRRPEPVARRADESAAGGCVVAAEPVQHDAPDAASWVAHGTAKQARNARWDHPKAPVLLPCERAVSLVRPAGGRCLGGGGPLLRAPASGPPGGTDFRWGALHEQSPA